jgi:hypothetical protein
MNRLSIALLLPWHCCHHRPLPKPQDAFGSTGDPKITLPGLSQYAPADSDGAAVIGRTVRMEAALTETANRSGTA